jgi:hypothetical protein
MNWRAVHIAALSLLLSGAVARPATAELVDLELVLAVDISGSIDDQESRLQRAGYVQALTDHQVVRAIKAGKLGRIAVTYVEWAGTHYQATVVDWAVIDGPETAAAFAQRLAAAPLHTQMWTSISGAIEYGMVKLQESTHRGRRRVIDVSGDGPNNDGDMMPSWRDRAVAAGVIINGLPIINDRPSPYGMEPMPNLDLYYEDCVIGGIGAFLLVANSFYDFGRAIRRKLILEIAGLQPAPAPKARVVLAAARERPPCDSGEKRVRDFREDF